jgi:hypothetical protein
MAHAAEHLADAAYAPAKMAVMTPKELDELLACELSTRASQADSRAGSCDKGIARITILNSTSAIGINRSSPARRPPKP